MCYGPYKKGLPANKQTLSRWIVDAITTSYESSDLPSPLEVKAHSTRGMAASKAFSSSVSMHDICNAAGWSTPLTFVRFYSLDLEATPGSSVPSRVPKWNIPGCICNHGFAVEKQYFSTAEPLIKTIIFGVLYLFKFVVIDFFFIYLISS